MGKKPPKTIPTSKFPKKAVDDFQVRKTMTRVEGTVQRAEGHPTRLQEEGRIRK